MRYGFTKPSKPHSSKVRQVKEYNAVQPVRVDLLEKREQTKVMHSFS